jgi:RNA polymerase sigma-70 factor (ECF subfamily)
MEVSGKKDQVEGDWRCFYRNWKERLHLFALQQTGNFSDGEDVLQEAIVKVWSRGSLNAEVLPAVVFAQIRRTAIDFARQKTRRKRREESVALEERNQFCDGLVGLEESDAVRVALEALPPEQQEVVVLKLWGGQTFEEIGSIVDIPANTAASRYRYALRNLHRFMLEEVV